MTNQLGLLIIVAYLTWNFWFSELWYSLSSKNLRFSFIFPSLEDGKNDCAKWRPRHSFSHSFFASQAPLFWWEIGIGQHHFSIQKTGFPTPGLHRSLYYFGLLMLKIRTSICSLSWYYDVNIAQVSLKSTSDVNGDALDQENVVT